MHKQGYRRGVGMVVMAADRQLLLAERTDSAGSWQFPQGGIDGAESTVEAMYRELDEELGLAPAAVSIIAETKSWYHYDIPQQCRHRPDLAATTGQIQKWFLLMLLASEEDIVLDRSDSPEFGRWEWVSYWEPVDRIVWFKRALYQNVLDEFEHHVIGG